MLERRLTAVGPALLAALVVVCSSGPALAQVTFDRTDYPMGSAPVDVAAEDFDWDGRVDFLVMNNAFWPEAAQKYSLARRFGKGDGTFGPRADLQVCPSTRIAVFNVDGSGGCDLVALNIEGIGDEEYFNVTPPAVNPVLNEGTGSFDYDEGRAQWISVDTSYGGLKDLASGDFDFDGRVDAAVTDYCNGSVRIYENFRPVTYGYSGFNTEIVLPVGSGSYGVATADFDRDGFLDLAVTLREERAVRIVWGRAGGAFEVGVNLPLGVRPGYVTSADFNGDSLADLAIVGDDVSGRGKVVVCYGTAGGLFEPPESYAIGVSPYDIAAPDVNGDGRPDLAVSVPGDDAVTVLLWEGGGFGPPARFAVGRRPFGLTAADFNDDGLDDLVVANYLDRSATVLMSLTQAAANVSPEIDLTSPAQNITVAPGATVTIAWSDFDPDNNAAISLAADLDGPPRPWLDDDHVWIAQGLSEDSLGGAGECAWDTSGLAPGSYTIWAQIDDAVNGKVHSLAAGRVAISGGDFLRMDYQVGDAPDDVAVGDFNRDFRMDMAVASRGDGVVSIMYGRSDGSLAPRTPLDAAGVIFALSAGDLNGDGRSELVVNSDIPDDSILQGFSLHAGRMSGGLAPPRHWHIPAIGLQWKPPWEYPYDSIIGDFDGDGRREMVYSHAGGVVQMVRWQADDSMVFDNLIAPSDVGLYEIAPHLLVEGAYDDYTLWDHDWIRPTLLAPCDADGDGRPEVAFGMFLKRLIRVYDGEHIQSLMPTFSLGRWPTVPAITGFAAGDFDRDGSESMACAAWDFVRDASALFVSNNPAETRGEWGRYDVGGWPQGCAVGDINLDGAPDVVVSNRLDADVSVFYGNGDGTLARRVDYNVGSGPTKVVIADANGDRRPDILVANTGEDTVTILYNNGSNCNDPGPEPPLDLVAPAVENLATLPSVVRQYLDNSIQLVGTAVDHGTYSSDIEYAECFEGADPGYAMATAMAPVDGAFDSKSETIMATLDTSSWLAPEVHRVKVRALDMAANNWTTPPAYIDVPVVDGTAPSAVNDLSAVALSTLEELTVTIAAVSGEDAGSPADNLLDGDWLTAWQTDGAAEGGDEFVVLDVGEVMSLAGVSLTPGRLRTLFPEDFRIETSVNGSDWTTCSVVAGFLAGRGPYFWQFESVDARYVRIIGAGRYFPRDKTHYWQIADATVYSLVNSRLELSWTAPCEDGRFGGGAAAGYDLRFLCNGTFEPGEFAQQDRDATTPAPAAPGSSETHVLDFGEFVAEACMALKSGDEVPNWSPISNIVQAPCEVDGFIYTFLNDESTCYAGIRPRWEFYKGADIRGARICFSTHPGFPLRPMTRPDGQMDKTVRLPAIGAMYNRWQPSVGQWRLLKRIVLSEGVLYWRAEGMSRRLGTVYGPTRKLFFECGEVRDLAVTGSHQAAGMEAVWPSPNMPPTFTWTDNTEWLKYFYIDISTNPVIPPRSPRETFSLGLRGIEGNVYTPNVAEWRRIRQLASGSDGQLYWRVRVQDRDRALTYVSAAKQLLVDGGQWALHAPVSDPGTGEPLYSWTHMGEGLTRFQMEFSANEQFARSPRYTLKVPLRAVEGSSYAFSAIDVRRLGLLAGRNDVTTLHWRVTGTTADRAFTATSPPSTCPTP